ncbi:MAG TPA: hypothetical protein VEG27_12375 [Usitatibacter sp.]|nr:hypothetical protein [Usitatibacter sp.]
MAHFDESLQAEQRVYADWLAWGTRLGFGALVVTYLVYLSGLLAPAVAPQRLPELWGLSLTEYLAETRAPTGWSWLLNLGQGDMLNLVGVAVLAAITLACYLRVLPIFVRARERVFVAICVAEVVVLVAAAAGVF